MEQCLDLLVRLGAKSVISIVHVITAPVMCAERNTGFVRGRCNFGIGSVRCGYHDENIYQTQDGTSASHDDLIRHLLNGLTTSV